MKITIQATAAAITNAEIVSAIPASLMEKIKKKNPKPFFQAYSIMQEGISKPKDLRVGSHLAIQWPRRAIQTLNSVLKRGLQFFVNHNRDNSTSQRPSVGRVVGLITKEIAGKLNQIAIGWFPDRDKIKNYDICSIEADVITRDTGGSSIAEKIESITGIALGSSARNQIPAFDGARRLASIQCFEDPEKKGGESNSGEQNMVTFETAIKFIRDHNVWPHQIFKLEDLKSDRVFGKIIDENEGLKEQVTTLETSNKEKDDIIKQNEKVVLKADAVDRLKAMIPKGSTEKQQKYIVKTFKPDKLDDLSDEALKAYVEEKIEDFKEFASVTGASEESTNENDDLFDENNSNNDNSDQDDSQSEIDKALESVLS